MSDRRSYEVVVVGGGPAGLTTALYTTRLGHRTAVFEAEGGRHAAVSHVHNLYGVSEDVSGRDLARHAVAQLQEYGGDYHLDAVEAVRRAGADDASHRTGEGGASRTVDDDTCRRNGDGETGRRNGDGDARFVVEAGHATVDAERVVFATGFTDVGPSVPGLERFTGRGLHYCLHCDVYGLGDSPTFVLGHGEDAAHVAMVLLNVTADVDLLLDGRDPGWSEETDRQLRAHPVDLVETAVDGAFQRVENGDGRGRANAAGSGDASAARSGGANDDGDGDATDGENGVATDDGDGGATDDGNGGSIGGSDRDTSEPWLGGLSFADGTDREYRGGFAMYGREYNTGLADALGCELADDGALAVDGDHETSVAGAYAVGDVTHGQNQTAIALGDGARAGVAIHKDLRRFPRPVDEPGDVESVEVPAASADVRARMRLVREYDTHAGLRGPPPER